MHFYASKIHPAATETEDDLIHPVFVSSMFPDVRREK